MIPDSFKNVIIFTMTQLGLLAIVNQTIRKILMLPIDEYLEKQKRRQRERIEIADQVIKIVTEGQTNAWEKLPRDQEHISYIINCLQGVDERLSDELAQYIGRWRLYATRDQRPDLLHFREERKSNMDLHRELRETAMRLVKEANRLRLS